MLFESVELCFGIMNINIYFMIEMQFTAGIRSKRNNEIRLFALSEICSGMCDVR